MKYRLNPTKSPYLRLPAKLNVVFNFATSKKSLKKPILKWAIPTEAQRPPVEPVKWTGFCGTKLALVSQVRPIFFQVNHCNWLYEGVDFIVFRIAFSKQSATYWSAWELQGSFHRIVCLLDSSYRMISASSISAETWPLSFLSCSPLVN